MLRRPGARPNSMARLRFSSTSKFSSSIGAASGACTFAAEGVAVSSTLDQPDEL